VTLGEGVEDTRRRVPLSELSSIEVEPDAMRSALDAFGRHRLLTFDRDPATREPTVEVAHEALLGSWARLRGWIDAAREDVRMNGRLADARLDWVRSGREPSYLLSGSRLASFETWASSTSLAVARAEREYLWASVERRDVERSSDEARRDRERNLERRSVKRLRGLVVALTVGFVVAGTLTAVAVNRNASAERAARLATSRELAGAALRNAEQDPQLTTLLALESIDTTAQDGVVAVDAEFALRQAMPQITIEGLGGGGLFEVSWTPDLGRIAIVGESGPTAVWEFAAGQPGRRVFVVPTEMHDSRECVDFAGDPPCDAVFHAALSPDGSLLATGHGDRLAHVWEVDTGRSLHVVTLYRDPLASGGIPGEIAPEVGFSPDGRYLWTAARSGDGIVWDVATGEEILRASDQLGMNDLTLGTPGKISFSRDSRFVVFVGFVGSEIWDLGTREIILEDQVASFNLPPPSFTDEGVVTIGGDLDEIGLVSLTPGVDVPDLLPDLPVDQISDLDFSPDGTRFSTASNYVRVWDVRTTEYVTLGSDLGSVEALAWSPDSRHLAAGWIDGSTRVWNIETGTVAVTMPTAPGAVVDLAFTPDGERLAVASRDGTVSLHVVDLEDLIQLARDRINRELTDQECREYLHLPRCPVD
jgi:WD40 repeat protein